MNRETKCIHAGYKPKNGEPLALPIYQSTTYGYNSPEHIGKLFDLTAEGHMYSRISNPTVECVEKKIAALEGGVAALCTSTGQSAAFVAIANILSDGDHFISSAKIYGGTTNLFAVSLAKLGIECTFVDQDLPLEELKKYIKPNTRAVFGETLANPALSVLDIEKLAKLAHDAGVPLIIDNTFPTPILCRPFEYGADIIIHSTSKYMDGHAVQLGGAVIEKGGFDWAGNGYTGLSKPDESYHGVVYTCDFPSAPFTTKARVQLIRDYGLYASATSAFLLDLGLQTLGIRMKTHCKNALAVAEFLEASPQIEFVNYPALATNKYHALAQKYLPDGTSGVVSFSLKGTRETAVTFMNSLQLAMNAVHVATTMSCILHPASSTHRQLTDEQLKGAGVTPGLIRFSVGIEHIDDILEDIESALKKCK